MKSSPATRKLGNALRPKYDVAMEHLGPYIGPNLSETKGNTVEPPPSRVAPWNRDMPPRPQISEPKNQGREASTGSCEQTSSQTPWKAPSETSPRPLI